MKYFFRRKVPQAADILLIESGSPDVQRRALESILKLFPNARYHLCTCHPAPPPGAFASVYRVTDYPSGWSKLRLLYSFRRKKWEVLVILCTGEPILWRWKMLGMLLLPAKVLVVNENADFFWLDWGSRQALRRFLGIRWGENLDDVSHTLLRACAFPLTLFILLCTAGFLYTRRLWRLFTWKINEMEMRSPERARQGPLHRESPQLKDRP
ncbi:MAG: hypothetical protein IH846_00090 [Acidobacteria bacterium]|nr:hypothetical protein [Acidobacteriota bacterium]